MKIGVIGLGLIGGSIFKALKDKYDTPRHEISPRIYISLFSCIHIMINFIADSDSLSDMVYWEAALYWLYYDKTLNEAIQESTGWSTLNEKTEQFEEIPFVILKEPWQTMYLSKQLNFKYGDTSELIKKLKELEKTIKSGLRQTYIFITKTYVNIVIVLTKV